ncbi:MAG TPA: type 1 glutamine amidotransferase [Solirubrobacteraceae bacterium]|nr:type 1 glutamine amidotransferase [Solirubrobacteraceae bacterium]
MLSKPGLILQHGEDGPPARLGEWLRERGVPFVVCEIWHQPAPDPREHAFVVSLGSERSANDADPGWVPEEIGLLARAVDADVPVLGICFGGQALSRALGGGSDPLARPEIGWVAIEGEDPSIPPGPWLQYHFEQMRVPPGARELARSPAGPAAFRHGRHLGLQFHPEADAALADLWARTDPKLPQTGLTPELLAAQSARHADAARAQAFALFDRWLASIAQDSHNVFTR